MLHLRIKRNNNNLLVSVYHAKRQE